LGESLKEKWINEVMDGQYIRNIDRQLIGAEDTFLWLSKGGLKTETQSENSGSSRPGARNKILCERNIVTQRQIASADIAKNQMRK